MILPLVFGFFSFFRAPMTWVICLLQVGFYFHHAQVGEVPKKVINDAFDSDFFLQTQGLYYANYIIEHPDRYPATIARMAEVVANNPQNDKTVTLGSLSFRDSHFLSEMKAQDPKEIRDHVRFQYWKDKFLEVESVRQTDPGMVLGVKGDLGNESWWPLLSYQFSHSGASHLIGNLIFMMMFGFAIEMYFGSLAVLSVFILSGVVAALFYIAIGDGSAVPLIGASGSVSGLMSFFVFLYGKRTLPFGYFLFVPKPRYYGIVYLPAWVLIPLWALGDLAGVIAAPSGLGSIGYSAHVGGQIGGMVLALVWSYLFVENSEHIKIWNERAEARIPFLWNAKIQNFPMLTRFGSES
jgi:membrane associated rhomboid family serine protease